MQKSLIEIISDGQWEQWEINTQESGNSREGALRTPDGLLAVFFIAASIKGRLDPASLRSLNSKWEQSI